jgi:enediyne biosynthesis protein E4
MGVIPSRLSWLLCFSLLAACSRRPADTPEHDIDWFSDRAHEAGLDFVHRSGASGKFYQTEIMPPGVALFDYDNDGDLDVFVVQSQGSGRLFRNDLSSTRPETLHFTDVTAQSGIKTAGYGMGVAAGDVDNDGCVDLYLTYFGRNQLWHNNCDGTFTDVSKRSAVDDAGWSVSASFFDYDRDGWLDLYVGHYLKYSFEGSMPCLGMAGRPDYCLPSAYQPEPGRLYHNNRNGTFTDVTTAAGIREFGPALGVVAADFNGDGWIDFYVANDGRENQLWMNQHDGTFRNTALLSGAALPADGKAEASMGVDAGDFDNDGDDDLFMTELTAQGNNLYVNDGHGAFEDRSVPSNLGPASLGFTGFGTAWFDYDNDGWPDLLTVNGAVVSGEPTLLRQRKQLFHNLHNGRFEDVSARAGRVFELLEIGRGAAFGDVDNDGDIDVVVANNDGPVRLLVNNVGNRNHWIGLRLVGSVRSVHLQVDGDGPPKGGHYVRDMLGARVEIVRQGAPTLWRRARADASYASANDPRVVAGLGASSVAPEVRVIWPDGRTEKWTDVAIDRYTTLTEGERLVSPKTGTGGGGPVSPKLRRSEGG